LAWTAEQLLESLASQEVPIEEKMSLYTARFIGDGRFREIAESQLERFLHTREWTKQNTYDLIQWRRGLEQTATEDNIKRGSGGTLDVEVLTHIFYAKHLHTPKHPWLRGTIERLESLRKNGVISPQVALQLRDAYYFLRGVESGLRLMNTKLRHDLPRDLQELAKLAYVLQSPDPEQLLESCNHYRHAVEDQAQRHYAQFRAQIVGLT
jgi:glutamate-ammonia-ligase adenylyltransferase